MDSQLGGEVDSPEAANPDVSVAQKHPSRRDVIRRGGKLVFVAPVLSTILSSQAYAAHYSCYNAGHACPGQEPCCSGLCFAGACTP